MTTEIHRHATRWSFGEILFHRITRDRGMVLGMVLRPSSQPIYIVVFEGDINEKHCLEIELTDDQPTAVTSDKS